MLRVQEFMQYFERLCAHADTPPSRQGVLSECKTEPTDQFNSAPVSSVEFGLSHLVPHLLLRLCLNGPVQPLLRFSSLAF